MAIANDVHHGCFRQKFVAVVPVYRSIAATFLVIALLSGQRSARADEQAAAPAQAGMPTTTRTDNLPRPATLQPLPPSAPGDSMNEVAAANFPQDTPMPTPDGGIPVALLGLGLASLGVGRRWLRKSG
ncbi:MAG: hypothetical protein IT581_20570 [Verrucomicrobiales bacterium]|nr:hypothetical protein [Verrucomicrobiales bacterium]